MARSGPSGRRAAIQSAKIGKSVLVVEKETAVYPLPRAIHFDGEIMRVFQSIGLREAVLETGGSRSTLDSFKAFRGREPNIDALLRHQGMAG